MSARDQLPYYRLSKTPRVEGARPPTEDEQANADAYAEKLENLLALSGGNAISLAGFIYEVAEEEGLRRWATRSGAVRAVTQCLNGHPMLSWGYDLVDATIAFLEESEVN